MEIIASCTLRNLKRYAQDRSALFFSLLSVLIVVVLYLFFLGELQIERANQSGEVQGVQVLIYSWLLSGLLCIPSVSVPLVLLTFKVEDQILGYQWDILVTPVKPATYMMGYILAAWVAGLIMSLLTLFFGELLIVTKGGELLSFVEFIQVVGLSSLINFSFSGFSFFVILLLKTNSQLILLNTLLNTLIGFFAGLYIPVGALSEHVGAIIKLFPLAHGATMLRRIIMEDAMDISFTGTPSSIISDLRDYFGIDLIIFGHDFTSAEMLLSLGGFGLLFYISSLLILKVVKRKE